MFLNRLYFYFSVSHFLVNIFCFITNSSWILWQWLGLADYGECWILVETVEREAGLSGLKGKLVFLKEVITVLANLQPL